MTDKGPRGYHDIGGDPAGDIPMIELPSQHWEKQSEALRALLCDRTRRLVPLDELRRGFESFGAEKYDGLPFYRRRLEAMTDILIEKGVLTHEELDAAIAEGRKRWSASRDLYRAIRCGFGLWAKTGMCACRITSAIRTERWSNIVAGI